MLKIVQLQYGMSSSGDFARRLHEVFLGEGFDSSIIALSSDIQEEERLRKLSRKHKLVAKLNNWLEKLLLRNVKTEQGKFSFPILGSDVSELPLVKNADIIYLHWVLNGFLNIQNMERLAKLGKPMVFILHDMWTITGGCHHSFSCNQYTVDCSSCQMFTDPMSRYLPRAGFKRKMQFYAKYDNLYFVSPSKWLYDCAKQSALTKNKPIFHIPNLLDQCLYKPIQQKIARHILNIDEHKKVIAFGAVSIKSEYKGWHYLESAVKLIHAESDPEEYLMLVFGNADKKFVQEALPFETKYMGFITDEYTMALVYNAADVFVAPSLADNLPYTIFEALSCGTPVTAFEVGGIPDLIEHQGNGYLARYKDAEDLADGIRYCLDNKIEGHVLPALETQNTVNKHLELFEQLKG